MSHCPIGTDAFPQETGTGMHWGSIGSIRIPNGSQIGQR